jgi:ankyrin repeat protein
MTAYKIATMNEIDQSRNNNTIIRAVFESALIEAVKRNKPDVIRYLVKERRLSPDTKEKPTQWTAIEVAVWFGKEHIVNLLESLGACTKELERFRREIEIGVPFNA